MKVGVFGGTFDPPHLGHLILAGEAVDQLGLDRLLWVVTSTPPHKPKQPFAFIQDRLDMTQLMAELDSKFAISRVDIDRPGPHYTLDTIRLLRSEYSTDELFFLMGGDSLHDLPGWYHAHELVQVCESFGVMRRPGDRVDLDTLEDILPGLKEKVKFIQTPLIEISSQDIRRRIREHRTFRFYLTAAVYQLIIERHLYLSSDDD